MLDVFLASIPLLWDGPGKMRRFAIFFVGLMAFNQLRLVLGFWLYLHGCSWILCHEIFAGFAFFLVFEYHCRRLADAH